MILSSDTFLSNTVWAWNHVLSLPVHPLITEADINKILKTFENNLQ